MKDDIEVLDVEDKNKDEKKSVVEINKEENKQPKKKKTKKVLRRVEPRKSKRVTGIKLVLLSILLIPLFGYLYIISLHSNKLINDVLSIVMSYSNIFYYINIRYNNDYWQQKNQNR